MEARKRIALVAHDARMREIVDWTLEQRDRLKAHGLWATGTTGQEIAAASDLAIKRLKSGPLGGDASTAP